MQEHKMLLLSKNGTKTKHSKKKNHIQILHKQMFLVLLSFLMHLENQNNVLLRLKLVGNALLCVVYWVVNDEAKGSIQMK
jgi:hypothetical protein